MVSGDMYPLTLSSTLSMGRHESHLDHNLPLHPLRTMNVSTKCSGRPFSSFKDILVWYNRPTFSFLSASVAESPGANGFVKAC